jgi:hypothetical protein
LAKRPLKPPHAKTCNIPCFFSTLDSRNYERPSGRTLSLFTELEGHISRIAIPHLNEVVIELAWGHGVRTWIRVKRHIRNQDLRPKELDELMAPLKAAIQMLQNTGGAGRAITQHRPNERAWKSRALLVKGDMCSPIYKSDKGTYNHVPTLRDFFGLRFTHFHGLNAFPVYTAKKKELP